MKLVGRVFGSEPFEVSTNVVFSRPGVWVGVWAGLVHTWEAADTSLNTIGEDVIKLLAVFVEAAGGNNNLALLGAPIVWGDY